MKVFTILVHIAGAVETADMQYIIRDHDRNLFEARKKTLEQNVAYLNEKYGFKAFELELTDQYYNMREK